MTRGAADLRPTPARATTPPRGAKRKPRGPRRPGRRFGDGPPLRPMRACRVRPGAVPSWGKRKNTYITKNPSLQKSIEPSYVGLDDSNLGISLSGASTSPAHRPFGGRRTTPTPTSARRPFGLRFRFPSYSSFGLGSGRSPGLGLSLCLGLPMSRGARSGGRLGGRRALHPATAQFMVGHGPAHLTVWGGVEYFPAFPAGSIGEL